MPRRLRSNRGLSAAQAHQALSVLLHDGQVRASDVWKALQRREHLLNDLKGRLAALGENMKGVAAKGGPFRELSNATRARKPQRRRKRSKPISAARKAAMHTQGRYLAAVRPLSKANRAKVKAIRTKSGVRAAIAAAKRIGKI
jgi:hypothetical protein